MWLTVLVILSKIFFLTPFNSIITGLTVIQNKLMGMVIFFVTVSVFRSEVKFEVLAQMLSEINKQNYGGI